LNYTQILYDITDRVATITLNRPERLNAFTRTMGEEIYDAFNSSKSDPDVAGIVFTGAGNGFCSGIDMKEPADQAEQAKLSASDFVRKFPVENFHCPKPTICAINGVAVGIGVTMSVSFSFRIAAAEAKFAIPFTKLGILPGMGSSYLLPKLIGRQRTLDLLMTARMLTAQEALDIGLVDKVVPRTEVIAAARQLAAAIAAWDPHVVGQTRALIDASESATVKQALLNEQAAVAHLQLTKASRM
jgi:2-(1,2-epoxy-1,2-dihydrophenyl)acetyl-CoA isomerase